MEHSVVLKVIDRCWNQLFKDLSSWTKQIFLQNWALFSHFRGSLMMFKVKCTIYLTSKCQRWNIWVVHRQKLTYQLLRICSRFLSFIICSIANVGIRLHLSLNSFLLGRFQIKLLAFSMNNCKTLYWFPIPLRFKTRKNPNLKILKISKPKPENTWHFLKLKFQINRLIKNGWS